MIPPIPVWRCNKRVGFLFPHPCRRITPDGCPDCQNGQVQDPYRSRTDRYGYSDNSFDEYQPGIFIHGSSGGVTPFAFGGGDSGGAGASMDFSEADGESLTTPDDNFEDDQSAS